MKDTVDLAVVQSAPASLDRERNVADMVATVRRLTAEAPTDLVVFPELATVGYLPTGYDADFAAALRSESETVPGPTTEALGAVARATGAAIVTGLSELGPDGRLYDSAVLVRSGGQVGGVQRKVHLWAEETHYFDAGDRFEVFDDELARFGLSICYDSRFPEAARVQALDGAEILICVFALVEEPGQLTRDTLVHRSCTRALENTVFYVAANRTGVESAGRFCGASVLAGPSGQLLAAADGEEPPAVRARLSAADLVAARRYADVNVDRRPEVYRRLLA